ncbi:mechanosensitive ion channel family protein [Candidatus Bipolaricaulota sp. J31]
MWDYIPRIIGACAIIAVGALAIHGVLRPLGKRILRRTRWKAAVLSLALSMATAVAWVLVVSGIFAVLKLTVIAATLSGSLALVALAVAHGAKNTTADIVAGLFLAVDEDLDIGYRVAAGGVEGVVERIDLRKTRIRDDEGKLHVIPNRAVEGATWIVVSRGLKENEV